MVMMSIVALGASENPLTTAPGSMAVMSVPSGFKLFYKSSKTADVKITIYNEEGTVVFEEKLHSVDGFIRPYNLTNLDEGEYRVELDENGSRQVRKITFGQSVKPLSVRLIAVAGSTGKYVLSVPANGSNSLSVRVFGKDGALAFSETCHVHGADFARVYDVRDLGEGVSFSVLDAHGRSETISAK